MPLASTFGRSHRGTVRESDSCLTLLANLLPDIFIVRVVPRLFLLREDLLALRHELREDAVRHVRCEVDLYFEVPIGKGIVRALRPLCRSDREDEAGCD